MLYFIFSTVNLIKILCSFVLLHGGSFIIMVDEIDVLVLAWSSCCHIAQAVDKIY